MQEEKAGDVRMHWVVLLPLSFVYMEKLGFMHIRQ